MWQRAEQGQSGQFRSLDQVYRHLLDQDDLLSRHMFLLQNPLQLPQAGQRFRILQRINDQQDVMVNNRLLGSLREPGSRPGRKTFYAGLGETTEAVVKEVPEIRPLFVGKHWLTLRQNRQPDRETVRQPL